METKSSRQVVRDTIADYAKKVGLFEQWGSHIDNLTDNILNALRDIHGDGYRPEDDRGPGYLDTPYVRRNVVEVSRPTVQGAGAFVGHMDGTAGSPVDPWGGAAPAGTGPAVGHPGVSPGGTFVVPPEAPLAVPLMPEHGPGDLGATVPPVVVVR